MSGGNGLPRDMALLQAECSTVSDFVEPLVAMPVLIQHQKPGTSQASLQALQILTLLPPRNSHVQVLEPDHHGVVWGPVCMVSKAQSLCNVKVWYSHTHTLYSLHLKNRAVADDVTS